MPENHKLSQYTDSRAIRYIEKQHSKIQALLERPITKSNKQKLLQEVDNLFLFLILTVIEISARSDKDKVIETCKRVVDYIKSVTDINTPLYKTLNTHTSWFGLGITSSARTLQQLTDAAVQFCDIAIDTISKAHILLFSLLFQIKADETLSHYLEIPVQSGLDAVLLRKLFMPGSVSLRIKNQEEKSNTSYMIQKAKAPNIKRSVVLFDVSTSGVR